MVPSLVFATVCGLGCSTPARVTSPVAHQVAEAAADTVTGCAAFDVRVPPGRPRVAVDSVTVTGCGGDLVLSLDSTSPRVLDAAGGIIGVRLRLQSRGVRAMRPPAQLYVWEDSIAILSAASAPNSRAVCRLPSPVCVSFVNSDSTTPRHAAVWRVESASVPADGEGVSMGRELNRELRMSVSPSVAGFRIVVHAVAQETPLVSIQPPATTPVGMYRDSSFLHGGAMREILSVIFREKTTQAQRQEAVDAVGGIVIGGTRLHTGDGYYYLRIPGAVTEATLRSVAAQLMKLPQVEGAAPLMPGVSGYLRPRDGTGWQTWNLDRHGYGTEGNWFLEADAAPAAWGCSVGKSTTYAGVVDHRFDSTEVGRSVIYGAGVLGKYKTDTAFHHGTAVTNILAATGNDGVGMTGMMWQAGILLAETNTSGPILTALAGAIDSLSMHVARNPLF